MFSCPLRQAAQAPQVTKRVDGDLVTHGHAVGQWAVGVDDGAGELVSQHRGERDVLLLAALVDANVGAAQQRCVYSEQHVTGFQGRHGHLLDPKIVRLMQHRLAQRAVRVRDRLRCSDGVRRGGHDGLPFKLVGSVRARRGWARSICAPALRSSSSAAGSASSSVIKRHRAGVGDQ